MLIATFALLVILSVASLSVGYWLGVEHGQNQGYELGYFDGSTEYLIGLDG